MATFKFTSANKVKTTGNGDHAFDTDTAAADSLFVAQGGALSATGADAFGAMLGRNGAWTVTINGAVSSEKSHGIYLDEDNAATSTITIGTTGLVQGLLSGLYVRSAANITNAGVIQAGGVGIDIVNASAHKIDNKGTITGSTYSIRDLGAFSTDIVANSGTLNGTVFLNAGADTLSNTGTINGAVRMGSDNDTVTNSKSITGILDLGIGNDKLTNSGTIGGSVAAAEGSDTVTNSGQIGDDVALGGGNDNTETNVLNNSGTILDSVFGGFGKDTVINTGLIGGYVDLAGGNDSFTGGDRRDTVKDGGGSDSVSLGEGNDVYVATRLFGTDGTDKVGGGDGIDLYDASAATTDVQINLSTAAHDFSPLAPGAGKVAANTATGADIAGAFKDQITGFENAKGGLGSDVIYGTNAVNVLEGGAGDDFLASYGGNDTLKGGSGMDLLFGGADRDVLHGGADGDMFLFSRTSDSGVSSSTRDVIRDFEFGDRIDLSKIDANTKTATDDMFAFIGTDKAFLGFAGQLRATTTANGLIVEGDVNGDKKADFSIELYDPQHAITLTGQDFLL
jgi:hypothetical protein